MKSISRTVFICALAMSHAGSAAASDRLVISAEYLNQLAEEMRTNHPALQAADARANAAGENVNSIRVWSDPEARIGGMAASERMRADDGDLAYGIEQKLPLFGKPKLARRIAAAAASAESANAEYEFQKLRADFARAAYRAALAHEVVRIGHEDLAWLDVTMQTIESKYRSGEATLVEVLQIQNEHSKRAVALQTERDQSRQNLVTLNRFLNRSHESPWPELALPEPAGVVEFNERLLNFALKFEPRLFVLREQIKEAEAAVELTRRERLPDVSVGVEARNYSGDGSLRQGMFTLSVNLPWGNARRYRSDVKREQSQLKAVEFDLADYEAGLREEVHLLTIRIDAARREALLYRDEILPRTQAAMQSARSGWEANRNSLRDLLDARRMLLEARLTYARAVSEQYQMLSELVLCCGLGDLGALQMLGAVPQTESIQEKHP